MKRFDNKIYIYICHPCTADFCLALHNLQNRKKIIKKASKLKVILKCTNFHCFYFHLENIIG